MDSELDLTIRRQIWAGRTEEDRQPGEGVWGLTLSVTLCSPDVTWGWPHSSLVGAANNSGVVLVPLGKGIGFMPAQRSPEPSSTRRRHCASGFPPA